MWCSQTLMDSGGLVVTVTISVFKNSIRKNK